MPADLSSILRIEVPVIVHIAQRTMRLKEVTNIVPGAIIELPKLADEELDLLVSHKQIGTGRAVKVGENFGLRVTYIGDIKERIEAMAGEQEDPEALNAVAKDPGSIASAVSFEDIPAGPSARSE